MCGDQESNTMCVSKNIIYILRQKWQFAFPPSSRHTPELWHQRVKHMGYDNLYKFKRQNMIKCLLISVADIKAQQKFLREPCVMGKNDWLIFS